MVDPSYTVNRTSVTHGDSRQFIGYIPDLLQELAHIIHFDYHVQPVDDASFGHRRLDGTWDGMVGQLLDGVSHLVSLSNILVKWRSGPLSDIYGEFMAPRVFIHTGPRSVQPFCTAKLREAA